MSIKIEANGLAAEAPELRFPYFENSMLVATYWSKLTARYEVESDKKSEKMAYHQNFDKLFCKTLEVIFVKYSRTQIYSAQHHS